MANRTTTTVLFTDSATGAPRYVDLTLTGNDLKAVDVATGAVLSFLVKGANGSMYRLYIDNDGNIGTELVS